MLIDSFANLNEQDFNSYLSKQIEANGVPRVIVFYTNNRLSAFKLKHVCDAFGIESCICGSAAGIQNIQGMMFWINQEHYFVYQEENKDLEVQLKEIGILAKRAFNYPHIFIFNVDLEMSTADVAKYLEKATLDRYELFYDPLVAEVKQHSKLKLLNAVVFDGAASGLSLGDQQFIFDDNSFS